MKIEKKKEKLSFEVFYLFFLIKIHMTFKENKYQIYLGREKKTTFLFIIRNFSLSI